MRVWLLILTIIVGCNNTTNQNSFKGQTEPLRISFPKYFQQEVTYHTHIYNLNTGSSSDETVVLKYKLDNEDIANKIFNFTGNLISIKLESDHSGKKVVYDSSASPHNGSDRTLFEEKVSKLFDKEFLFSISDRGNVLKNMKFKDVDVQYQPIPLPYYLVSFPEKEMSVGSFWENVYNDPESGEKVTGKYKIKSIKDQEAVIDARLDIDNKRSNEKQYFIGHYKIDMTTGMPISCNMSGRIVGTGIEITYYFTTKTSTL